MSTFALSRRMECHSEFWTLWEMFTEDPILVKRIVHILGFVSRCRRGSPSVWILLQNCNSGLIPESPDLL